MREVVVQQRHEEHQGDDRVRDEEWLLPDPRDEPGADGPAGEQHVARCEERRQREDDGGVLHRAIAAEAFLERAGPVRLRVPPGPTSARTGASEPPPVAAGLRLLPNLAPALLAATTAP